MECNTIFTCFPIAKYRGPIAESLSCLRQPRGEVETWPEANIKPIHYFVYFLGSWLTYENGNE